MKKIKKYIIAGYLLSYLFFSNLALAADLTVPSGTGLPDPGIGIKGILTSLMKWALAIFGIIAIISFIVSGLQYLFAAGDEKAIQTAKRNATYSIVGVIVALAGLVIIQAIDTALRGTSTF